MGSWELAVIAIVGVAQAGCVAPGLRMRIESPGRSRQSPALMTGNQRIVTTLRRAGGRIRGEQRR